MAALQEAKNIFNQFQAAYSKGDSQTCLRLLSQLKIKLTHLPGLPPAFEQTVTAAEELKLARDVLEAAVFLSLKLEDETLFERNFQQLQTYYTDTRGILAKSPSENLVIGLNLLRLLVQNRIAEFHTELELISPQDQQADFIKHSIQLEQWLMEGAYNKVLAARQQAPDPSYAYFMDLLSSTVRDEVAGCAERAYPHLVLADAQKMFKFGSDKETLQYAQQRGWRVEGGRLVLQEPSSAEPKDFPALEIISNALTYARELERIV